MRSGPLSRFFHLEERLGLEIEHPCNHIAGEHFDAVLVPHGRIIVVLSGKTDLVLRPGQLFLQLDEVLVCLEVRVSLGHRNILGLRFDPQGRLWEIEHGPAGGDELNLVTPGANYGWPNASNGSHYDGRPIPDHSPDDGFAGPAISWNPVIAPGDMIFYTGEMFREWSGNVVIAAMKPAGIVRVAIDGTKAREVARYAMENRIRAIAQAPDGAIWIAEDGKDVSRSRLLRLTPATGK